MINFISPTYSDERLSAPLVAYIPEFDLTYMGVFCSFQLFFVCMNFAFTPMMNSVYAGKTVILAPFRRVSCN